METDYKIMPSQSLFPSKPFRATAEMAHGSNDSSADLLAVEVFFSSMSVSTTKENPVFESVRNYRLTIK